MAEYIDREFVKEIMQKYRCLDCTNEKSLDCPLCQLHRPFAEISKIPTADVVQKSEYKRLEKSFNELKQETKGYLNRIYGIRADVAMEIFDDIDKILKTQEKYLYCNPSLTYVYELIEELKKKYI